MANLEIDISEEAIERIANRVVEKLIGEFRSPTVNTTWERTRQEIERQMTAIRENRQQIHREPISASKAFEALEQEKELAKQQADCEHKWEPTVEGNSNSVCRKCGAYD